MTGMTGTGRAVLTGATGFIGTHLRKRLPAYASVVAVTRGDVLEPEPDITWARMDLADPRTISWPADADTLIYAAQSREYREFPGGSGDMVDVNVRGPIALLAAGARAGLRRVIYLSSGSVYAPFHTLVNEDAPVQPASFYAHTKRMAELVVAGYAQTIECTILRLFTVYGPGQREMLVPRLFDRISRGEPISVGPTGGLTLSPVYVDDVCGLVERLLQSAPVRGCRTFNVGGAEAVTIQTLATAVGRVLGKPPAFEVRADDSAAGWAADTRRVRAAIGWAPAIGLREGLRRTAAAAPIASVSSLSRA